jgi:hypothetical protein
MSFTEWFKKYWIWIFVAILVLVFLLVTLLVRKSNPLLNISITFKNTSEYPITNVTVKDSKLNTYPVTLNTSVAPNQNINIIKDSKILLIEEELYFTKYKSC